VKKNIIANFFGRTWSVLIAIVSVPFYINFLGIESYGLIGFFSVLMSSLALLEFGLSTTINRDIARYAGIKEKSDHVRDLSRSLEYIYWIMGILIAIVFFFIAPAISKYWIRSENLSIATVQEAIVLMGICIAFQWPISLYNGGMMGLEKQVSLNIITAFFGTLRALGAVILMIVFKPSISLFFQWQVGLTLIHLSFIFFTFWKNMPKGTRKPQYNQAILKNIWKFTAGMGASGIVTFLLSNLDKLILSKILGLSEFGGYNVASTINNASKLPASSVFSALFPRFASLHETGDNEALRTLFHKGTQFISFIVFPLSAIIVFYSYDIIYTWSQNAILASSTCLMLSILVLGSAINVSMGILGDLIVASGLSNYVLYQNLISVVFIVPLMIFLSLNYGGLGAAIAWLILNIGYLFVSVPILINKTQPGELRYWYVVDFGKPIIVSFAVVGLGKFFIPHIRFLPLQVLVIGLVWLVAQLACFKSLPHIREYLTNWWTGLMPKKSS
jgi:O-antigen/teichoic acid export membrane protein